MKQFQARKLGLAAQARAQEQLSAAMAAMVTQGNIEAEAEAKRKAEENRIAEEAAAEAAAAEARKAEQEAEALRKAEVGINCIFCTP